MTTRHPIGAVFTATAHVQISETASEPSTSLLQLNTTNLPLPNTPLYPQSTTLPLLLSPTKPFTQGPLRRTSTTNSRAPLTKSQSSLSTYQVPTQIPTQWNLKLLLPPPQARLAS